MPGRLPAPEEIKELLTLIRRGHLFAVERWIKEGKPYQVSPETRPNAIPLLVAIEGGFHSMVELLLSHGGGDDCLQYALSVAVNNRRLDLVELLCRFGAEPKSLSYAYIAGCGSAEVIRWLEEQGTDLVTDWPVAKALAEGNRIALGTLMRWKDRIPDLQAQLDAALRVQARKGSLRWVSLLMWAGGNPRVVVPDITDKKPAEWMGTALEDGSFSGKQAVMQKLGVRREDDVTSLLCRSSPNLELTAYLIELGADPNAIRNGDTAMTRFMRDWEWNLDSTWNSSGIYRDALKTLEFLGTKGGRWVAHDPYQTRCLRAALGKARPHDAISGLKTLIDAGVFEQQVFRDLMATPKMKELLAQPYFGGIQKLRDYAGHEKKTHDSKTTVSSRSGAKRRMERR